MDGFIFLVPIVAMLLVLVPVTGLTVILTSRFALKPMVEALVKALEASGLSTSSATQIQIRDLSEQVEFLSDQMARIQQTQEFDLKLMAGRPEGGLDEEP